MDAESWMRSWNEAYAPLPTFGGSASGIFSEQTTQIYLNGDVFEEGGVAISVGGDVKLAGVVSQGCTPIGEPWTLTRVEQNLIHQIANRPAYAVLAETFQKLPPADQQKARGNLLIGLVVNEYLEDFHRGDFLVRQLIGGDPNSGVLAVGALPRAGQTMQFQRRDAAAASEDMSELLVRAKKNAGGATIYGGCLCCCNGRGKNLFGVPNHDAGLTQKQLGPLGLAGFFCNGEIGPVGEKSFLHGFHRCARAVREALKPNRAAFALSPSQKFFMPVSFSLLHLLTRRPFLLENVRGTSAGNEPTRAKEKFQGIDDADVVVVAAIGADHVRQLHLHPQQQRKNLPAAGARRTITRNTIRSATTSFPPPPPAKPVYEKPAYVERPPFRRPSAPPPPEKIALP